MADPRTILATRGANGIGAAMVRRSAAGYRVAIAETVATFGGLDGRTAAVPSLAPSLR
ncbi:hypothetical protein [Dactylosporangium sp. NPDC048998]|uniref:hypothetical protein n=1 Tax=Dactylosporangium sp. NPDC048998 TaxID=3363976 RepID=UPI00370FD4E9